MTSITATYVGGPTLHLAYAGLTFLTDPTFDPPGGVPRHRRHPAQARRAGRAARRARPGRRRAALARPARRQPRRRRPALLGVGPDRPVDARRGGADPGRRGACDPWEQATVGAVTVTAVPARHGPEGAEPLSGVVTGFVLQADGWPTVYVSGDNASLDVVDAIARRVPDDRRRRAVRGRRQRRPVRRRAAHARRGPGQRGGRPPARRAHRARAPHGLGALRRPARRRRGALHGERSAGPAGRARARARDRAADRRHAGVTPRNSASRSCSTSTAVRVARPRHPLVELERELLALRARSPGADDLAVGEDGTGPADGGPERLVAGLVGHQELAVASLQEQVVRAEEPDERLVRRIPQRGEVGVEDARTVPVDLHGVVAATGPSRPGRSSRGSTAACFGVSGPSRCRRPRSRSTGPSSLSSGRSSSPPGSRASAGCGARPAGTCPAPARAPRAARRAGTASRTCGWRGSPGTSAGTARSSRPSSGWRASPLTMRLGRRPHASSGTPSRARRGRGCRRRPEGAEALMTRLAASASE